MNEEKAVLRRRTRLRFIAIILRNGTQNIIHNRKKRLTFLLAALAIFAAVAYMSRPNRYPPMIGTITAIGYTAIGIAALAAVIYLLGRVPHAWNIYDDFVRIGWVNSAGEAPVLITYERRATHLYLLRFWCRGLPREEWEDNKEVIETAINLRIIDTMDGDDRREVILLCTDASCCVPMHPRCPHGQSGVQIFWRKRILSWYLANTLPDMPPSTLPPHRICC